ncbi:hypothetical protein BJV82DRAFT_589957 [Fennellomyces sp. T-0311]|nr:hypothetical protein BJV82DRAFT_589957 [Fennellomyces sp. T-0311]
MPSKHPTDLCPICETEPETVHHCVVECPLKTTFWIYALQAIRAPPEVSSEHIWEALNLRSSSPTDYCAQNLPRLGLILQTVWAVHWRSVLDGLPWNFSVANNHLNELIARYPSIVTSDNPINLEA